MKVLFVSSGGSKGIISPIIKNQGNSLKNQGVEIGFFPINGRGIKSYLKAILELRKQLKLVKPNIIHAHYGLCGIVALIARRNEKLIVSFMGDDIIGANRKDGSYTLGSKMFSIINKLLSKYCYNYCIVKSEGMYKKLKLTKKVSIIPNGVDISEFKPVKSSEAFSETNFDPLKKHILFVTNPSRVEKNFILAKEAMDILGKDCILEVLTDIPNEKLRYFYSIADTLLLTSFHEGSPNVVKEAMACNCPVVSTPVGDVEWLFGGVPGHYISSFVASDVSNKIANAISFRESRKFTEGRNRILELNLDNENVAKKILEVYTMFYKE